VAKKGQFKNPLHGCQIFLCTTYQRRGKIYQITTNYTKLPQTIPNYHKLYIPNVHKVCQMAVK
jgi:hypothetical protein